MAITDIVLNEFTGNSGIFPTPVNQNFERLKDGILTRYDDVRSDLDEISTVASGAFPKSGGTMTGNLTISKSAPYIYLKNTAQTAGTIPSSNQYERIYFQDNNGTTLGQVGNIYGTDGSRYSYITSAKGNGTGNAQIQVGYDASGNEFFSFPKCTTKATTTSTASNGKVAVIVQNYVNGTSWYRVWSDGWIEQGGRVLAIARTYHSGVKVSLLKSFSNNDYSITLGMETVNNSGAIDFQDTGYFNKAKNSFYVRMEHTDFMTSLSWEAKGY